jgi:hypothetical protein
MILYSSGYSLNFKSTEIKNSITIKADTIPRGANININQGIATTTPTEISTEDEGLLNIKIEKQDFLTENFLAIQNNQQNTFADLTNLWLLPNTRTSSTNSVSASSTSKEIQHQQIISENQSLIKYTINNKPNLGIVDFGIGGRVGDIQPVSTTILAGGKSTIDPELTPTLLDKIADPYIEFKKIGNDLFFKNNVILIRKNGFWLARDLDKNFIKSQDIARINNSSIAILDQSKTLWIYNIETETTKFVDSGFSKMKVLSTPSSIWLWRKNTIYRLEASDILAENLLLNKFEFLKNNLLEEEVGKSFDVQNLFQGIAIQTGRYVFYIPDFKKNQWQVISSNTFSMATLNETMVWLDNDKNLFLKNFSNENIKNIAQNIELTDKINYSEGWKRIMLYYPQSVRSVWFNKDSINTTIKTYFVQNWIENQSCFPKVVDRSQYCIQDNDLQIYKNNNIF